MRLPQRRCPKGGILKARHPKAIQKPSQAKGIPKYLKNLSVSGLLLNKNNFNILVMILVIFTYLYN